MNKPIHILAKEILGDSHKGPELIPRPELPKEGHLSRKDQWKCILWSIENAEKNGVESLKGLALAFSRVIQASIIDQLFTDTRPRPSLWADIPTLLWDESLPLNQQGHSLNDLLSPAKIDPTFSLRDSIVFASPWNPERMLRVLQLIGDDRENGPWQQDLNHQANAWLPLPIVWVVNGNHSTTAGILRGEGELKCINYYDASALLKAVTTDGEKWFRADNGEPLGNVKSIQMAGILEIARRISKRNEEEQIDL